MRNVRRVHVTDIWSWYRVDLRVGDHLGRSEELVSRCVECDLAEPESLASLGGSAPGVVDGILSPQSISIRVHPKSLIGMPYAHSLHGHPHPASRTLSMSPPGMAQLQIPRITSRSTFSLEILSSTSPDAVKLLQQTPSSLTPLLLMMVPPWPSFSVAVMPLSVMHMASNQPNNSSTLSLITSE